MSQWALWLGKQGTLLSFFFVLFFFLCIFLLSPFLFEEVTRVQRDITQTQISMGKANFGLSAETGESLQRVLVRAYEQDCCHTHLQNK